MTTGRSCYSHTHMFLPLINTHVENVLLQKYTGSEPDKKFLIEPNFSMQPKKDLMRLLLRIRSFLLSICDLYGKFCLSAPAPSVFVKQLFALFFCRKNRKHKRKKLYQANHTPNRTDCVDLAVPNKQQGDNRKRQQKQPDCKPPFSKIWMCKHPRLVAFHRHCRSVSVYVIDLFRGSGYKYSSESDHHDGNQ